MVSERTCQGGGRPLMRTSIEIIIHRDLLPVLLEFCHSQIHIYVSLDVGWGNGRLFKPLNLITPDPFLRLHRLFGSTFAKHAHRWFVFAVEREELRVRFALVGEYFGLILVLVDFGIGEIRVELCMVDLDRVDSLFDFRVLVVHCHLAVGVPVASAGEVHDLVVARVEVD